jgi:hypothetical protein
LPLSSHGLLLPPKDLPPLSSTATDRRLPRSMALVSDANRTPDIEFGRRNAPKTGLDLSHIRNDLDVSEIILFRLVYV